MPEGSSPHTRGALLVVPEKQWPGRIIPAYAGSTMALTAPWMAPSDHPRIRGEHADGVLTRMSIGGSSPHTRGAPVADPGSRTLYRIIPAYAGSTPAASRIWISPWDHPRIRGEHLNRIKGEMPSEGSSPHTRGARSPPPQTPGREGIIPAYAGSTSPCHSRGGGRRDHPRIRGEHLRRFPTTPSPVGSSPHTRGARRRPEPRPHRREDHPRIRGEHPHCLLLSEGGEGSSPHTRGAPAPSLPGL